MKIEHTLWRKAASCCANLVSKFLSILSPRPATSFWIAEKKRAKEAASAGEGWEDSEEDADACSRDDYQDKKIRTC